MKLLDLAGRATTSLAAALFVLSIPGAVFAEPDAPQPRCQTPHDLMRLGGSLAHVAQKIDKRQTVTIVAIGSSSTAGAGASSPASSYPSRLSVELQKQFPAQRFSVINQGVNG